MQQKIKEVFTEQIVNYNNFTKEAYKLVRNKGKKLEIIAQIEEKISQGKKINEDQREKLSQKESLSQSVKYYLEILDLYRQEVEKSTQQQDKPQDIEAGNKQEATMTQVQNVAEVQLEQQQKSALDNEANVVEYSIQQQPKQQSQQTSQGNSQSRVHEPIQQVKLLVKDHTSVEESVKLAVAFYVISSNIQGLQWYSQTQLKDQELVQDLNLFFRHMTNISINPQDLTFEARIKRATDELTKIATDQLDSKISSVNEDVSHSDMKKIIQRVISNKELKEAPILQLMYLPMMLQTQIQSASPMLSQIQLPTQNFILPTQVQANPQVQNQEQSRETVSQNQQVQSQTTVEAQTNSNQQNISPQRESHHLNVQNQSPKKDMSKSPMRQPGAIEQVADVKKNLLLQDWNDDGDEDDEDENDEIGERRFGEGLKQDEDQHEDDYDEEEEQPVKVQGDEPSAQQVEQKDKQEPEQEDVLVDKAEHQAFQNKTYYDRGEYRGRGGNYRGRGGNFRGNRGGYNNNYNYRGRGNYEQREQRGGYDKPYQKRDYRYQKDQAPDQDQEVQENQVRESQEEEKHTGDNQERQYQYKQNRGAYRDNRGGYREDRGGFRENRGGYRGRGNYQGNEEDRSDGNAFYRNKQDSKAIQPISRGGDFRGRRDNREYAADNQEIVELKEDISKGGFQVVTQRGQKDEKDQHPTAYGDGRGPRIARGAPRSGRGGYRGDGYKNDGYRGRGYNRGGDYGNRNFDERKNSQNVNQEGQE
ncbi:UNKNOWN [Stylonychia lemnae]|uniref:Uncharacterized protein n=1 Tax=Stylonychia lemnae TaxID=5949 RepID=A0A077ZVR3_STYLE|nr:UNKNOWN [Stylonychia lemnae]|eukprot:CDW72526.1 UNKNOWN [Stylonychia lemnae]